MKFVVHGIPQPAGSKRGFVNPKTTRVIITDDAKKSRPWKAQVADAAAQAMNSGGLIDRPVVVGLHFYMPRPKSHYGARGVKPSAPAWPTVRPDIDKLSRACLDALTGIVYRDDAQIIQKIATKQFGEPARVEIEVLPILEWQPATREESAHAV